MTGGLYSLLRHAALLGAMVLAAGCAPTVERMGTRPPVAASLSDVSFSFGAPPAGQDAWHAEATQAVGAALVARGYRRMEGEARYRVDVGLAVVERGTEVVRPGEEPQAAETKGSPGIVLCKRTRYALSVAMIDRVDGRIVFRNSAKTERCDGDRRQLVEGLVEVAFD